MKRSDKKINILELSKERFASWLEGRQIESYRAAQVFKWIYLRQADRFDLMTDIAKDIRPLLEDHFTIDRLQTENVETSIDGSRKYLFKLEDGERIESVLIPERDHYTLCISSQVGCAQDCRFCLTASGGFQRNLSKAEIVSQVRDIKNELQDSMPLSNLVFMGMGEPLANYKNLVAAIQAITDSSFGLGFASRRVTVSTAGIVSRLADLGRDTRVNLAISLNATDNQTRNRIMPINRKFPIEKLLKACQQFPLPGGRRITFEYVLLKDVNDSVEDAYRLAELLRPIKSKINLIPFNSHEGCQYQRPDEDTILRFQKILIDKNYTVMIRQSKGQDISAACGQLAVKTADSKQKTDDRG
ncbi:MAG: 23S rRNA (adenine(2503)-C(2))-methyltransferase RlmN [Desulfobacterales bacterium]|nr:23S rRNA (adenine(2503)-C(2))-methyltransferase RlmN [Desulfobacterales bacterium]